MIDDHICLMIPKIFLLMIYVSLYQNIVQINLAHQKECHNNPWNSFVLEKILFNFKKSFFTPVSTVESLVMKNSLCVFGIQIFYALSGYNLNVSKNICIKFVIWIILACNLILVNYSVYNGQLTIWNYNMSINQRCITYYQSAVFWFYHHALIFKVSKIASLIATLSIHLRNKDIIRCFILSFIIPFLMIISVLISLTFQIYESVYMDMERNYHIEHDSTWEIPMKIFIFFDMSKLNWAIISDTIYILIFYVLYRAKSNQLHDIEKRITKKRPLERGIHEATGKILNMHNTFESTMSIFPFLSISYLFFNVSQTYYYMDNARNDDPGVEHIWLSIFVIFRFISFCILLYVIQYFTSKLSDISFNICQSINFNQDIDSLKRTSFITIISRSIDQPVTGWGMFTIDSSLFSSFLSSLVTFTLLFIHWNIVKNWNIPLLQITIFLYWQIEPRCENFATWWRFESYFHFISISKQTTF